MGTKKFLTCVDKYQASCFPLRPCRHATNKRRPRPDRTGPSRQLLTLHLSTDFDFEARPGPSDLHARLAISIATLLDDHVAVATAAADRDVAVAIALDALLIADRSDAVLIADTGGVISAEPAKATANVNAWAVRISGFLFWFRSRTNARQGKLFRKFDQDAGRNSQFQITVPSGTCRRSHIGDRRVHDCTTDDEMNAR